MADETATTAAVGAKEYSSLPLTLTVSSAVVLSVVGGWLLQDRGEIDESYDAENTILLAVATDTTEFEDGPIDIDAELRKARLAAGADLLVGPAGQSALYFYGRINSAEPDDPIIKAELDAVLAQIADNVGDHLDNGEYDEAYALCVQVAKIRPEHALLEVFRTALDSRAAVLVEQAVQYTQDGNDAEAVTVLQAAEELPGLSPAYLAGARESIDEIKASRVIVDEEELEKARLATETAIAAWTESVRGAITAGQLLAPEGDNAREYLAQRSSPEETRRELTGELINALIASAEQQVKDEDLAAAELHIDVAEAIGGDEERITALRNAYEAKSIEVEGDKILSLSNLVRLDSSTARYPRRAYRQNITGWVEVTFRVLQDGTTADIVVVNAEPRNTFEKSAVEAVGQWTFEPREFRGQPISQRTAAKLVFDLQ